MIRQQFWRRAKPIIELLTLLFVAAYTVITYYAYISTQTASQQQLRAYIGTISGGIENFGDAAKQTFTLTLKNYGLTPAYRTVIAVDGQDVIRRDESFGIVESTCGIGTPNSRRLPTIFPGGEFKFSFFGAHLINNKKWLEGTGQRYLYYGTICYRDAFDAQRYTNFCWSFDEKHLIAENAQACAFHSDSN